MQKGGYLDSLAEFIGRWCINQKGTMFKPPGEH